MSETQDLPAYIAVSLAAMSAAVVAAVLLRQRPMVLLGLWLSTICIVPYWLGVPFPVFIPVLVPVAALIVLALWGRPIGGISAADAVVIMGAFMLVVMVAIGSIRVFDGLVLAGQWLMPYWAGRMLFMQLDVAKAIRAIAIFGSFLGAAATVEFFADWHPFSTLVLDNYASKSWSWIQYRAGYPRSEWSLGHSIALGNVIAMTAPFLLLAQWSLRRKLVLGAVALSGVVCTLSRNALVAFILGLVIVVALRSARGLVARWTVVILGCVAALAGLALAGALLQSAADEIARSTESRFQLLAVLRTVKVFGESGTFVMLRGGDPGYVSESFAGGVVRSVDSAFVYLALNTGWVVTIMLTSLLLIASTKISVRNPAAIAVIAQIPTLLTVALITQYSSMLWLLVGAAISIPLRSDNGYDSVGASDIATRLMNRKVAHDKGRK